MSVHTTPPLVSLVHVALTHRLLLLRPLDARALVRLQSDHINRTLVPAFYRYLQAQDPTAQIASGNEFRAAIDTLVGFFERADEQVGGTGLWKEGGELGWADVMVGPCELWVVDRRPPIEDVFNPR